MVSCSICMDNSGNGRSHGDAYSGSELVFLTPFDRYSSSLPIPEMRH